MPAPKIVILVPTYNPKPEHLQEALASLENQTIREWTAVIHDDASTVDVRAMISPFLADSRFVFKRSEERLGIGGNWNACLSYASAPVVQYLFQDDLWEPEYLKRGLKVLDEHPSIGFVSIDHEYRYEGGRNTSDYYGELNAFKRSHLSEGFHSGEEMLEWWLGNDLKPGVIGEPSFVMMRRALAETCGPFLEDMPQSLDNEFWTRCLLVSNWFFLKESLGAFRVHAGAASAMNDLKGAGLADRLRIYQILLKKLLPECPLRDKAKASAQRALSQMIRKFFARRAQGKSVSMRGGSTKAVLSFAFSHPLLTLSSLGAAA